MNNQVEVPVAGQTGLLETVKEKVNLNQFVEKVSESRGLIMDALLYGGVGFLTGYFLKRYSNVVIILVLLISCLAALQQFELIAITVYWEKIHAMLGLSPAAKVLADNFLVLATEWAKANMHIVVSSIIGFLCGLKIA
jgi:uncharacterized membrane protein (Fun14 family)